MKSRTARLALLLSTVALVASLLLNLLLYREARRWARLFFMLRLDPLGLAQFSLDVAGTEDPLVLFFGDSRAYDWPAPTDVAGFTFTNRATSGHSSVQAALAFEHQVAPLHPEILLLQVGVNDLATIPFMRGDADRIIANTKRHIEQIVDGARAQGSTVILTTIFPTGRPLLHERPLDSNDVATAIIEVNDYLRSLAERDGVLLLDAVPLLADDSGQVRPAYSQDYLHLKPAGYEALNTELARMLAQLAP